MEANNELTRAQLLASPPQSLEDVDTWFVRYNAVIDAARAEALRVERLRDAAPDLVKALRLCRDELASWDRDSDPMDPSNVAIDAADAALAKAGA